MAFTWSESRQPPPGFEPMSSILFTVVITVTLSVISLIWLIQLNWLMTFDRKSNTRIPFFDLTFTIRIQHLKIGFLSLLRIFSHKLMFHFFDKNKEVYSFYFHSSRYNPRIHPLHICRGVRPHPTASVSDIRLNHLMARFRPWIFRKCRVL